MADLRYNISHEFNGFFPSICTAIRQLKHQLDGFKKQLFGPKSEKQVFDLPQQGPLFSSDQAVVSAPPEDEKRVVQAYQRGSGKKQRDDDGLNDTGLRFNDDVPVEVIETLPPELTGPDADQYNIIGCKTTYRLAQRAASYVVLKLERPVFRRKGDNKPITTPAPFNVLDNRLADVSLLAGLMVDKFPFHLPLYRQHQRLQQAGITLSRSTLTNLVKRAIALLRPIVDAQTQSVLRSRVLAIDETPVKSGHQGRAGPQRGKMKSGWFWPLYGDADEVVFTYSNSRGRAHIDQGAAERPVQRHPDQRWLCGLCSICPAATEHHPRPRLGTQSPLLRRSPEGSSGAGHRGPATHRKAV